MGVADSITSFKQLAGDLLTPGPVPYPERGATGKKKKKKKKMTTMMMMMMMMTMTMTMMMIMMMMMMVVVVVIMMMMAIMTAIIMMITNNRSLKIQYKYKNIFEVKKSHNKCHCCSPWFGTRFRSIS